MEETLHWLLTLGNYDKVNTDIVSCQQLEYVKLKT